MSKSADAIASASQAELGTVRGRMGECQARLNELREAMSRTREYLLQATYAHKRGWPCPRCGRPMEGYEDGRHPCLAIERQNEVEAMREILMLETELMELQTVEAELIRGVNYVRRPLPVGVLHELAEPATEPELQQKKLRARRVFLGQKVV